MKPLKIVICGLSITSSWGNGHATTYRALMSELSAAGHEVWFLERDRPWYAENRDLPNPPYGRTELYTSLEDLKLRFTDPIASADAVIVGSFVPEGIALGAWVIQVARGLRVFYDIDTPETLASIGEGSSEYLSRELIPKYDLYLSFTGGPTLKRLETEFNSPMARALYCSVDARQYYPAESRSCRDLGYLGTFSWDRQATLEEFLLKPARLWSEGRFIVAGAQFPSELDWGPNVEHLAHLPPSDHRDFYNGLRFTLNITRRNMIQAGYSPSVRLFEAAACATPIISDYWPGIETLFEPGTEILIAEKAQDVSRMICGISDRERRKIGERARARVLNAHTAAHRVGELERHLRDALSRRNRYSMSKAERTSTCQQTPADNCVNQ